MLREPEQRPEAGFLGASGYFGSPRRPMLVQFWRSFEHRETYARSRDAARWPAWVDFNKRAGSSGDIGISHETHLVPAGAYACVYNTCRPPVSAPSRRWFPLPVARRRLRCRAEVREAAYPDRAPTERIEF
jgi:hypothetical protein